MARTRSGFRLLVGAVIVSTLGGMAGSARAACGDGVLDTGEQCDAGAANGTDGCCSAGCTLVDADYDGSCDAVDPCDDNWGVRIKDATLTVTGLGTPRADDRLRFAGTMTIGNTPAIDPSVAGMHLRIFGGWFDPFGTAVADVAIPGGEQWTSRAGGSRWRYRDGTGSRGGIRRIALSLSPSLVPTPNLTKIAFVIEAERGSFPITPTMVTSSVEPPFGSTMQVTLALGGSASNRQCANVYYTTVQATRCTFGGSNRKVTCKGPPPVGPCHLGDPNDLVVCDLLNAARAEDAYFAAHGTYFGGHCSDLPSFVASPGVLCTASGGATAFSLTTFHPNMTLTSGCVWNSDPGPGSPNITCS